ncbi:ISAs1 family transposase [Salmonella enterica subsp. enterica serovar Newport]|uniref:ISAs1 family transposase n=1 Tax=Salmonella enterica subsp. salamae TaxID=59202 RepID=A0A5Y3N4N3_SALER|nr:ISAs1 family transposase [Salmonella enterica]ECD2402382.1 ISAs1 family transposase [Salmonella enterica subsp. enterica serovar Newport]ECI4012645.1 ISAs1 family transposase [Salmonella enterica subsp. salamae]
MSVTNSKAKPAVKTSRKAKNAASASDTVLSAVLALTAEQHVPLSALVKSPMNVRIVPYSAESVREKGIGLLQNLVVHALPDGLYGVAAGGRRLAAMNLLATENTITPDWPVRVKVVPDDLATAASLTENGQHLEMHPAEQIAGFRALAAEGKTPAQTGDLLGYSPRHVQRMLKLAGLAPVILEALAADKITTEHCQALALEGCIVTIDAMGTQPNIAESIRERRADYVLAVKNNQPLLAESINDFFTIFRNEPEKTPHTYTESTEKSHGRVEVRRCYAFNSLECLYKPERWPELNSFAVVETLRESSGRSSHEYRFYISSLSADAEKIAGSVRAHWSIENRLHWCMDVVFADDQMRARSGYAAHNLAVLKQLTMNMIRLDPVKRKGGIKIRRLIATISEDYMSSLLGSS